GNTITGGGSGRQPGSSWKPFVLATAFSQGVPPTKTYPAPGTLPIPGCKPNPKNSCVIHNDEPGGFGGNLTLAGAMAASVNTVYAQLAPDVGCPNIASTAKALGIESAFYSPVVQPFCQTYALGVVDVSPLDMASAYGVFDNHGQRAAPTPVLQVLDPNGHVLVDNIKTRPPTTSVLSANVADNITSVLQGVIAGGTGTAAALGRPAAGKTGTTSNYTNAWFAGYTPTLSTAVWMGRADSQSAGIGRVKGVYPVYGGTWPALTWRAFMAQALAAVTPTPFNQPAPITPPAAALATTTTVAPILPGPAEPPGSTPAGGPYEVGPPPVSVPVPQTLAPPTLAPPTLPATTTTTFPGFPP
ncbi:MAG: transglycosylase domain-containing protein, partial [Acidimicrobiales bacterium]